MISKTAQVGSKTQTRARRPSPIEVKNKNEEFDYSFKRMADLEEHGMAAAEGWIPVGAGNSDGESWNMPTYTEKQRGASSAQLRYYDTILCRRPKKLSRYFAQFDDQKYNDQKALIKQSARNARIQLRDMADEIGADFEMKSEIRSSDNFSQRTGPTEEDDGSDMME